MKKGFTLIELLVVIAIIGLLSSLAVVSLSSARNKAYDAQVKSDLSQIRTYATVTYPEGNYTGLAIANVTPALTAPTCAGGNYTAVLSTDSGVTSYAVYSELCADDGWFCVDSSGQAQLQLAADAKPTAGATVVCP